MRFSGMAALGLAVMGLWGISPAQAQEETAPAESPVEAALALSRQTGAPILAIAGSESCGFCVALHRRMETDAALRPLLAQFVPLHLDVASPEWQDWARRFPVQANAIPLVYVIRADGETLYAQSGAPQGEALPQLLTEMRAQSGTLLNARQSERLTEALEKAKAALAEGDIGRAVAAIAPVAENDSFAAPAAEARQIVATLTEQGQAAVAEAEQRLASSDEALAGALSLVEVVRQYKKLPAVVKQAAEIKKTASRDPAVRLLFSQAAALDKARGLEAAQKPERAAEAYRAAIKKYPDTAAAAHAQERLDVLAASATPAPAE